MKKLLLILTFAALTIPSILFSQTDITEGTVLNMPGNWGYSGNESMPVQNIKSNIPETLLNDFTKAKQTGNESEKLRLSKEIEKYSEFKSSIWDGAKTDDMISSATGNDNPPWLTNDILVHTGDVAFATGFRQMDLKQGKDGYLYLAVNRRNVAGSTGSIIIYRSSNGGLNWSNVSGVSTSTAYYGTISMLVERRGTDDDSTRILVYYSRSTSSNMNDATINFISVRRNGTAAFTGTLATPPAGNKFEYPSATSDGQYWTSAVYMHIVFREASNAGAQVGLRHFQSTTWGESHTGVAINTGNDDRYPSAAFCWKGGNDSIYIAVERRNSSTEYEVRVITTPENPTNTTHVYYITAAVSGTKYEKPCITAVNQSSTVPRKILVTCTRDSVVKRAVYHYTNNGGSSWSSNLALGPTTQNIDFTWCNSDSNSVAGGYLIASFVDTNGDSVTVRRGVLGSMGTYLYKRNGVLSTGTFTPVCEIYQTGGNKYSALAYAGSGPTNVYFDQENLTIGINQIGNVVSDFNLSQNYPNPFNPKTSINFSIPKDDFVKLTVYNILGKEVAVLVNQKLSAGQYNYTFDATNLTSGIYFYKISSGDFRSVKKMSLIK